ncbi:cytochrome B [Shewanella sp. OPT22]|nr:cytochrome B [Shewanella sp. OPT22]
MQLKNTTERYGLIAMLLHWIMALTIFGLFGLGLYMVELSYYDEWYRGSLELHKAIGIILVAGLALRVLWRKYSKPPQDIATNTKLVNRAAKWAHRILYLILATLLISGYLISTADGRSIDVFGIFEVIAMPSMHEQQEDIAGVTHWGLAWTLIIMVGLHAAAAVKHHFIDKDDTLKRILP